MSKIISERILSKLKYKWPSVQYSKQNACSVIYSLFFLISIVKTSVRERDSNLGSPYQGNQEIPMCYKGIGMLCYLHSNVEHHIKR